MELGHWTKKRNKTSKSIFLKHQKPFRYLPLIAKICKFLSVLFRFFFLITLGLILRWGHQIKNIISKQWWDEIPVNYILCTAFTIIINQKFFFFFKLCNICLFGKKNLNKAQCSINCSLNKKFTSSTWISINSIHYSNDYTFLKVGKSVSYTILNFCSPINFRDQNK